MKRLLCLFMMVLLQAGYQHSALAQSFSFDGNPLVRDCYTADPAPMVASDGRLYVYCGHDECFEDKPGYEADRLFMVHRRSMGFSGDGI